MYNSTMMMKIKHSGNWKERERKGRSRLKLSEKRSLAEKKVVFSAFCQFSWPVCETVI
jgi:hypothetical protein